MIYTRTDSTNMNNNNIKNHEESCTSKLRSFIKNHPFIFYGIILGIIVVIAIIVVICIILTRDKDDNEEKEEKEEEIKIFPFER